MSNLLSDAVDLRDVPKNQWSEFIGPGYRSCCFTIDHNKDGVGVLFGFDRNGTRTTFLIPHQLHTKYVAGHPTQEKDLYGRFVSTSYFRNQGQRKKWIETSSTQILECLPPENEILHELFDTVVLDQDFNTQPLRVFYLDIETEISDKFMKPSEAGNRINMITIYDSGTEKFYTWSLEKVEVDFQEEPLSSIPKEKFQVFSFQNKEKQLLEHFLDWWESNYPDVVCGYNSQAYDIPYIVRRIENVLTKTSASRLSPIGKYRIQTVNHSNERANKEAEIEVKIQGIFSADELVLYRDKFGIRPSLDGGYSLDNVGEAEGLGKKIKYDGTLKDLYLTNFQKFYEYNVRDVDLLKRIEDKCKLIPLARNIAGGGLCNYNDIYSSISYLIGSLIAYAKTEMGVVFQSYVSKRQDPTSFEGAYVFPPIPGLYKGGIATIDFNSLYPSSIRAMNVSPETYIGKVIGVGIPNQSDPIDLENTDCQEFIITDPNGNTKTLTKSQLLKLCNTRCIFTQNNTLFLKHSEKQGIVSSWCKYFYGIRKSLKSKMKEKEHQIYTHSVPEQEIPKIKTEIQNLDSQQYAKKIQLNSIYGCLGTVHSPIGNVDLAQTITRTGKFCNTKTADFIKSYFQTKFKTQPNEIITISGDTDSQFININPIIRFFQTKFNLPSEIKTWDQEHKLKLWKFTEKFVETIVNPYVQDLVRKTCFTNNPDPLRYSLEYIADSGIYEQKKRYAVHKVISEGPELVDKFKFTGIELKRSNIPVQVKKILSEIYINTLTNNWTNQEFKNYIKSSYSEFSALSPSEIAFWYGWNSDEIKTDGFLKSGTGMTAQSKAAHFYNQIIEKLKLGKKYEYLKLGSKMRLIYVKPKSKFNINTIAFLDQWPKEFNEYFLIDYETMFEKQVLEKLKSFRAATGFEDVQVNNNMVQDIFDF